MTAILILAIIGVVVGVICMLILLAISTEVHDHYTDGKYWHHFNRSEIEKQNTSFEAFKKSVDHNFYNSRKRDNAMRTAITEKFKQVTSNGGQQSVIMPLSHTKNKVVVKSKKV